MEHLGTTIYGSHSQPISWLIQIQHCHYYSILQIKLQPKSNEELCVPSELARISVTLCLFFVISEGGPKPLVSRQRLPRLHEKCPYRDARGLQELSFRHQVGLPGKPCKQHLQAFSMVDTMYVHRARENTLNVCDLSRHIRVISDRNKIVIDHLGPVGIRTSRFLKRERVQLKQKRSVESTQQWDALKGYLHQAASNINDIRAPDRTPPTSSSCRQTSPFSKKVFLFFKKPQAS